MAKITNTTEGHIQIQSFHDSPTGTNDYYSSGVHMTTKARMKKVQNVSSTTMNQSVYCNQRSCTPFSALKAVQCQYLSRQAYNQVNQNHVHNGPFIQCSIHWCKLSTDEMNIKGTQCGYYMLLYVPAHFSSSHLKSTGTIPMFSTNQR